MLLMQLLLLCGTESFQVGGKDAEFTKRQPVDAFTVAAHVRFKAAAATRKHFGRLQHFIDCSSAVDECNMCGVHTNKRKL